ncbi:hypothetical protein GIB67_000535 [Kingdonia uniflora]|uniref:BHLH domain-containing protein n=1 Tax=Kingdonia uniflora TaxID=39325 RepID=A0A7J7MIH3_9MAGN|nr:hypothetical protein GIB67_000535 [Kingdonia uniflora]
MATSTLLVSHWLDWCKKLGMVSEIPSMATEINVDDGKVGKRSITNKKKHLKVPKKIHKAEREKLKRDHLNDLFLDLSNNLDCTRHNNGKASILGDASRLLKDLLAQIECLKRENKALLFESNYVTAEKNELKDENSVLEGEIEKLQTQLQERSPLDPINPVAVIEQRNPVVAPVFVIPLHDFQSYPDPETIQVQSTIPSNISRPHARYPTPSDSWPSQLLANQSTTGEHQLDSNCTRTN